MMAGMARANESMIIYMCSVSVKHNVSSIKVVFLLLEWIAYLVPTRETQLLTD